MDLNCPLIITIWCTLSLGVDIPTLIPCLLKTESTIRGISLLLSCSTGDCKGRNGRITILILDIESGVMCSLIYDDKEFLGNELLVTIVIYQVGIKDTA